MPLCSRFARPLRVSMTQAQTSGPGASIRPTSWVSQAMNPPAVVTLQPSHPQPCRPTAGSIAVHGGLCGRWTLSRHRPATYRRFGTVHVSLL